MFLLVALATALAAPVTVEVNHAFVKDRAIDGARIALAPAADTPPTVLEHTGPDGRVVVELEPGTWHLAVTARGYVTLPPDPIVVPPEGRVVTATLTPLLESMEPEQAARRRVQVVLNWGSRWTDVADVDAHLICHDGAEVYYAHREHRGAGYSVDLDVDDVDWGGPETITLWDPPPGTYRYFVRNFSGRPAHLGASDVVVRVLDGDRHVGTFHVPEDLRDQDWSPFRALEIDPTGVRVVPFTDDELAAGLDRASGPAFRLGIGTCTLLAFFLVVVPMIFIAFRALAHFWRR